jgi:hypothetical protein
VVALAAAGILLPGQARASEIAAEQPAAATVSTTFEQSTLTFTSVFSGKGVGPVDDGLATSTFQLSVHAQQCCTVHSFVLGPWTGTWSVDGGNGDTVSGTAAGSIAAACTPPVENGASCAGEEVLGPTVAFTLTITGGTGLYAGASGTGTLQGEQTPQDVRVLMLPSSAPPPIAISAFAGTLSLSLPFS